MERERKREREEEGARKPGRERRWVRGRKGGRAKTRDREWQVNFGSPTRPRVGPATGAVGGRSSPGPQWAQDPHQHVATIALSVDYCDCCRVAPIVVTQPREREHRELCARANAPGDLFPPTVAPMHKRPWRSDPASPALILCAAGSDGWVSQP